MLDDVEKQLYNAADSAEAFLFKDTVKRQYGST